MKQQLKSLQIVTTNMICKNELKGKYVRYVDKDGKTRTEKVVRIAGNYLTMKNAVGVKHRVHKDRIRAREFRKRGLEEIEWG